MPFIQTLYLQIRGQDFLIDLLGITDIVSPVAALMTKCQAVNLPPWKIGAWFPRVIDHLKKMQTNIDRKINEVEEFSDTLFPRYVHTVSYTHLTLPTIYSV